MGKDLKFYVKPALASGGGYDNNRHFIPKLWETEPFVFHSKIGIDGGDAYDVFVYDLGEGLCRRSQVQSSPLTV